MPRKKPALFFWSMLFILPLMIIAQTPLPEPGIIHQQIGCRQNPAETYALYLPGGFTPDRTWPLLISLDPGGRVMIPMNLFEEAAENGGYILICPTGVRNGPVEPAVTALSTVWTDVITRLPIDGRRIYAAGFSGGARMASLFPLVTGQPLAGILACGAGLSQGVTPEQLADTLYLGVAGFADFNYAEMARLEQALNQRPRPAHFFHLDQAHQWPAAEICLRAVSLFDIQAMKDGLIPRNTSRLAEIYQREARAVTERSRQGDGYFAAREADSLHKLFSGLLTPAEMEALEQLKNQQQSKAFRRFQKEEANRLQRESDTLSRVAGVFGQIRRGPDPDMNPVRLIAGLGLQTWVKLAAETDDPYESGLARRILSAVVDAARDETLTHLGRQQLVQAEMTAQIRCQAARGSRQYGPALYDHGCIHARMGRKKEAMKALREAVENGFSDRKLFMEDPDLASLRSNDDFQALLKELRQ